ncbi:dTMP kinase [Candidatus Berkelbacteria bacterium CG10_big_fil_rev_8_21_14_0_10_43_13]|uniref:Thymidylate kinase n=1 Tax=Candidatus Berkelbacteria bacterium CG10_big_fil_rev_8_21_14_0_10_43_13 TaxID=1974514 RepID=A0A2H0W8M5_9BACT|nr:MAG: dTMP kinase [Candidatus Berkelbacteria bacterium CG10_big_fil_rev_8_21_14_0_10_43_13]
MQQCNNRTIEQLNPTSPVGLRGAGNKTIGHFIVIDGSDGAGKKTQSDLLITRLKKDGHKIAAYDFPVYDSFFGKMIGRYLNGEFGQADEVDPYLVSVLYAGDRWQASQEIKNDLDAGKVVIANRYIQSNMAYQTAKFKTKAEKDKYLKWLSELEFQIYQIPKPDLVIYLYVPFRISQALVDKKAKRSYTNLVRDIHEKDADFLSRVEKSYLMLAEKYPEWRKIDCVENGQIMLIDEIAKKVYSLVKKELK